MSLLTPLQGMVEKLRRMAHADRGQWLAIAHEIEGAPRALTSEGGIQAVNFVSAARILASTAAHAAAESEADLRGILLALSNAIENERVAMRPATQPYYLRD